MTPLANYQLMNPVYTLSLYAIICIVCWAWVGLVACIAIFSVHVNDTVLERIGLAWVSIGCFAAAWNILERGDVSETVLFVSTGFGYYVSSVFMKCWRCAQRNERIYNLQDMRKR